VAAGSRGGPGGQNEEGGADEEGGTRTTIGRETLERFTPPPDNQTAHNEVAYREFVPPAPLLSLFTRVSSRNRYLGYLCQSGNS
jgi:hypothetical protein